MKKCLSIVLLILTIFMSLCCNNSENNKASEKELELQKRELDIKQKEIELREKVIQSERKKDTLSKIKASIEKSPIKESSFVGKWVSKDMNLHGSLTIIRNGDKYKVNKYDNTLVGVKLNAELKDGWLEGYNKGVKDMWGNPIRNWGIILQQFLIIFESRCQL